MNQITEARRSRPLAIVHLSYVAYCLVSFTVLGLAVLTINLFLPQLRQRRAVAGVIARAFMRVAGIPFTVKGLERLPRSPCVVVANHASYIDAIVIVAALPPDFAFVIKKETERVPLVGLLLRGLGSQFVERFNRHKGASDARRVLRVAAAGQSLMFFPEGTFDETRQIRRFLNGAFAAAARSKMPVVSVAIHGTRDVMPPGGGLTLYRKPICVEILEVMAADEARLHSREMIARAVGDPVAP